MYGANNRARWEPARIIQKLMAILSSDGDNKREVLFSIQTQDELNEGVLISFDHRGEEMWRFTAGDVVRAGNQEYSSDYRIRGFDIFDFDHDGKSEVVVCSRHRFHSPNQLVLLSHSGEELGEYWNFGYFVDFIFVDINNDGFEEIICGGMNNEYDFGCIVIFDPKQIAGCSPQKEKNPFHNMEPGTEMYYILLPRTDLDLKIDTNDTVSKLVLLDNQRISVTMRASNIYYEFGFDMRIREVKSSHLLKRLLSLSRLRWIKRRH